MGYLVPVQDWLWTAAIVVARVSRPVYLAVSARPVTALESHPTSECAPWIGILVAMAVGPAYPNRSFPKDGIR